MDMKGIFLFLAWSVILPYFASPFEVRLADGSGRAGRVEVYRYGLWGTVCDDFWDINDAVVVCRQLGFVGAIAATRAAIFGEGTGLIMLDNVECVGDERKLEDCIYNSWNDCYHNEDAGVICKAKLYEEGDIRLIDEVQLQDSTFISVVADYNGRVQVFSAGGWDNLRVCVDTFDIKDASVVCRQLGFDRCAGLAYFRDNILPYADIKSMLQCSGDETRLDECSQKSCADVREVYIHCEDALTTATITTAEEDRRCISLGKPRLVDGNSTGGRVEICLNERWGTVCDHNWDMRDADVVCRELGFKGADAALLKAHFGQGQGPVYIEEVECFGNEISIFSCNYTDSTNCEHEEDAGVNCIPNRAGDVRLVDGNSTYGLVEAYVAYNWATVCGRNWGLQEAAVTCRQLGFKDALFASNQAPKRNSSMAVDQVNCTGGEKSLLQCKHKNDSNCRYLENAFVACIPGENFPDQEGGIMETQRPLHQDKKGPTSGVIILVGFLGIFICILATIAAYRFVTTRYSHYAEVRKFTNAKVERPLPSLKEEKAKEERTQIEEVEYEMIVEQQK